MEHICIIVEKYAYESLEGWWAEGHHFIQLILTKYNADEKNYYYLLITLQTPILTKTAQIVLP